jgi:hypothetical protein
MALLVALTLGLCIWMLAGLILGPVLISRVLTQGAQMIGGFVGTARGDDHDFGYDDHGPAPLPARTIMSGRSPAMMNQVAARAGSAVAIRSRHAEGGSAAAT